MDFRYPNITATTEAGQLEQLKTYLFQLTNQLNYAIKTTEDTDTSITPLQASSGGEQGVSKEDKEKADTFYAIKDFIINSADIIEAYSEEITKRLKGVYVAESDFGTYKEETDAVIQANSTNITTAFSKTETIESYLDFNEGNKPVKDADGNVEPISEFRKNDFYLKTGWLYNDGSKEVGGIEIGQMTNRNGTVTDVSFARFTPERLSFYDSNGVELAYFGNLKLNITNARIEQVLELNKYKIDTSNGIAFKWIG